MGENRIFYDKSNRGSIKILKKGTAWMRDGWLTDSKWSINDDFMLHGWKDSILVPRINESSAWKRATARNKWGKWYNPLASEEFDEDLCMAGKITWKYWKSLMISSDKYQKILQDKREAVQRDFYYYSGLVPNFL